MDQLRALWRVGYGAPIFGALMFAFGLIWSLIEQEERPWVSVISALIGAVVAAVAWYLVIRARVRGRHVDSPPR
jgi:uncharacterized BrkB/YihY/UPF0761 family membrane protein